MCGRLTFLLYISNICHQSTQTNLYSLKMYQREPTCQRILDGIERSEKYQNFANIISETQSVLKKFISFHNKEAEKSSVIIVRQFVNFLDRLKKKYCVQKWRVDWKEYTVIFVEFKNAFDFKTCLESASLKKEARRTFENIFSHFNDVRLYAPYVEIREVELHNK